MHQGKVTLAAISLENTFSSNLLLYLSLQSTYVLPAQSLRVSSVLSYHGRRYLEEQFVLKVMAQLTLALKECHRRSDDRATVLHRDLKPANIFLDIRQNVKLGDFGLARILNHDTSFAKTFVGTPYYMSPVSNLIQLRPSFPHKTAFYEGINEAFKMVTLSS